MPTTPDDFDDSALGRRASPNSENQDWTSYLRLIYYLAGMFWAAGAGDQAIMALAEAAKTLKAEPIVPAPRW